MKIKGINIMIRQWTKTPFGYYLKVTLWLIMIVVVADWTKRLN
jgi:hypothetical protein